MQTINTPKPGQTHEEWLKDLANFHLSLKVCAFIAKPKGLEVKFVNLISNLVDEITSSKPEHHAQYVAQIQKVITDPALGRLLHMQFTVIALQEALNAGGLIFAKFWQSCLNGMPNQKFTYNLNK